MRRPHPDRFSAVVEQLELRDCSVQTAPIPLEFVDSFEILPDLVILDLREIQVPADLVIDWRRHHWHFPVLAIRGPSSQDLDGVGLVRLNEPFDDAGLIRLIEASLFPARPLGPRVLLRDGFIELASSQVIRGMTSHRLTSTEVRLISFLVSNEGRTLSPAELLKAVWGYRKGVHSRTVATTIARLRAKVEVNPSRPVHLLSARGVGYRFSSGRIAHATPTAVASTLLGRSDEITRLHQSLDGNHRLTTLVGMPGIGKSAIAEHFLIQYGNGYAAFARCDLSVCDTQDAVEQAIAAALGLSPQASGPLRKPGRVLVVLDNFDRLQGALTRRLAQWLESWPEAHFLVTGVAPTGLPHERVLRIGPLDSDTAIALFRRWAQHAKPDWRSPTEDQHLPMIVATLDFIPLAIQLAAQRVRTLALSQIWGGLQQGHHLLQSPDPSGPPRHHSMDSAFAWAFSLFGPLDRSIVTQASVFSGSFTLDDVHAIVNPMPAVGQALNAVENAVRHNLCEAEYLPDHTRFRFQRSIRLHLHSNLSQAPELWETARRRHMVHFYERVAALWPTLQHGASDLDGLLPLHSDVDNLVFATETALRFQAYDVLSPLAIGALHLLARAGRRTEAQGLWKQAHPWVSTEDQLWLHLAQPLPHTPIPERVLLLEHWETKFDTAPALARFALWRRIAKECLWCGQLEKSALYVRRCVDLAPHPRARAQALHLQALWQHRAGTTAQVVQSLAQCLTLTAAVGDRELESDVRLFLSKVCLERGELIPALHWATEANSPALSPFQRSLAQLSYANAEAHSGRFPSAIDRANDILLTAQRLGNTDLRHVVHTRLGEWLAEWGEPAQARSLHQQVLQFATELGRIHLQALQHTRMARAIQHLSFSQGFDTARLEILAHFERAQTYAIEFGDQRLFPEIGIPHADALLEFGDFEAAADLARRVLTALSGQERNLAEGNAWSILAEAEGSLGKPVESHQKAALSYLEVSAR